MLRDRSSSNNYLSIQANLHRQLCRTAAASQGLIPELQLETVMTNLSHAAKPCKRPVACENYPEGSGGDLSKCQ